MSSPSPISLKVTHRDKTHIISLQPDSTIGELQSQLEDLTSVEPALQKLLYKGKKSFRDDSTLVEAGLKDGMKVQMLGSTAEELGGMRAVEDKTRRILRERALKTPAKVRSTATQSSIYVFHEIRPLDGLPNPSGALAVLQRLSNDPAVKHIMNLHKFRVGLLSELGPNTPSNLLGLNTGSGQKIELRLRTENLDGFRLYKGLRQVLCHELAHNVHNNHDTEFQKLNSQLNREVAEFERSVRQNTHYLSSQDVYEPQEIEAYGHILGGGDSSIAADESMDERRRRILEATMSRLRKEEEDIEHGCGTTGTN